MKLPSVKFEIDNFLEVHSERWSFILPGLRRIVIETQSFKELANFNLIRRRTQRGDMWALAHRLSKLDDRRNHLTNWQKIKYKVNNKLELLWLLATDKQARETYRKYNAR